MRRRAPFRFELDAYAAAHEAGHAVIAMLEGFAVVGAEFIPSIQRESLGWTVARTEIDWSSYTGSTPRESSLCVLAAGAAAEIILASELGIALPDDSDRGDREQAASIGWSSEDYNEAVTRTLARMNEHDGRVWWSCTRLALSLLRQEREIGILDLTTALSNRTEPTWWLRDWCDAERRANFSKYADEISAYVGEETMKLSELRNSATGELLEIAFRYPTIEEVETDPRYKIALRAHRARQRRGLVKVSTGRIEVAK